MVDLIKTMCAQNGTSIKALERELGFGNGTIRRWDDSRPSYEKIQKVADYFGVSVDHLLQERDLVERIRALCKHQKTSLTKLEEQLGFGNGTIGKWKNAKSGPPVDKLNLVAEALGTTADYLLTGETEPEEPEQVMSDEEIKLVNLFKKASPEMQAAALAILRASEEMKQMKAQLGEEAETVTQRIAQGTAEKFGK